MFTLHFRAFTLLILLTFIILPATSLSIKVNNSYDNITDLAIGNSHARSLNFSEMGLVGLNAYIAGADVREAIQSFHLRKDELTQLERIWIPVAPVFLFREKSKPSWARTRPGALSFVNVYMAIQDYSNSIHDFWMLPKNRLNELKNRILSYEFDKEAPLIFEGAVHTNYIVDFSQLSDLADETARSHAKDSSLTYVLNQSRIVEFVQEAESLELEIIFFTPPYTKAYYTNSVLAEYRLNYRSFFDKLSETNGNVYFFDFHDLFNQNQYNLFSDDDHLNFEGSKVFSTILFRALGNMTNKSLIKPIQ